MPVSDRQGKGDVIYRQDAISVLGEQCKHEYNKTCGEHCECMEYRVLRDMPSAQKKGHWRNYEGTLTCSVCKTEIDNGIMEYCGDDVPMFCPCCGADMRGDANEDLGCRCFAKDD